MPTDPTGRTIRNALDLRRFENGIAREIGRLIDERGLRLQTLLLKRDPTAVTGGFRKRRLKALNGDVGVELRELYAEIRRLSNGQLVDMALVQQEFANGQLERTLVGVGVNIKTKRLGREFWRAIITEDPVRGAVMGEWWSRQRVRTAFAFKRELQVGLAQEETIGDLIRRVRGRSIGGGRFRGGVMQTSTREATALVRTAVTQVATRAHFETFKANEDITEFYIYTATLDASTSDICIALDGREFRYDDASAPRPPQNFNCRSTIVPKIKWKELGITPPKEGQRAAMGGPVPARTDYSRWLRDQPKGLQEEILGPGRAALFRGNKLSLRDLIRSDNSSISLEDLRKRVA